MSKLLANFISMVFHPLLIVTYMLILLMMVNPYLFGISHLGEPIGRIFILRVLLTTFFLPLFATSMLKFLGMVESFALKTREDHYIPYVAAGIFYLWVVMNFIYNPNIPIVFTSFLLGATIALFIAFFINLFSMISVHTVGMGALLGMVVITMLFFSYGTFTIPFFWGQTIQISMNVLLIGVILFCGMVGSARIWLIQYDPIDIYGGYLVGFLSQFIAMRFMFF